MRITNNGNSIEHAQVRAKYGSDLMKPRFVSPSHNENSTHDNTPAPEVSPFKPSPFKNSMEPSPEITMKENYSDIMKQRWLSHIKMTLDKIDCTDANDFSVPASEAKGYQAQPEYAQNNYQKLRQLESNDTCVRMNYFDPHQNKKLRTHLF